MPATATSSARQSARCWRTARGVGARTYRRQPDGRCHRRRAAICHLGRRREILSLEHTASLLEENTDIQRQPARAISQPPTTSDPRVRATATGSPAVIPRERLFQRVWPRMMIGVMFVLEVAWIVFLVHLSIFLLKR